MTLRYAQWIRADVHVHTPFDRTKSFGVDTDAALTRYSEGDEAAIRDIALRYYESCTSASLGLVGVTDHNTCRGHEILKPHLDELNRSAVAAGSSAILFLPGVEITVGSERPVHILLLFEEMTSHADVRRCIAHVFGVRHPFDAATGDPVTANCTVPDFLGSVRDYCQPSTGERRISYVVIPAHVGSDGGLVHAMRGSVRRLVIQHQDWNGFQTTGSFAEQNRDFQEMLAEWVATKRGRDWSSLDTDARDELRSARYWPLVQASDPARFEDIGTDFTWLKMEEPSLEGLRLALLDPESRLRSANAGCPACEYPHITWVRIQNSVLFNDLSLPVSPQLNTFIGGRGTGKTSVLEYIRHCLDRARQEDFVGGTGKIREELASFLGTKPSRTGDRSGTLLDNYRIQLGVRVAGSDYQVQRDTSGIRVLKDDILVDSTEIDVRALVEPVVMSQRQMAAIARDPEAQRLVLDSLVSPNVRRECADARRNASDALEDAQRERDRLAAKIAALTSYRTQLLQLEGHIEALKAPGCEALLEKREQVAAAESWLDKAETILVELSEEIHGLADTVARRPELLPSLDCVEGSWLEHAREDVMGAIQLAGDGLLTAAGFPKTAAATLRSQRETQWNPGADKAKKDYDDLVEGLLAQGVDLSMRSEFNDQKRILEEKIEGLALEAEALEDKLKSVSDARDRLVTAAQRMCAARTGVVDDLASQQSDILVEVHEMRDRLGLLGQRDTWFAGTGMQSRDWEAVVEYVMVADSVADRLQQVVEALRRDRALATRDGAALTEGSSNLVALIGEGNLTRHYFSAIARTSVDALNGMERYIPEDSVDTRFRDNDGVMKSLDHASLGQKSTAILALLLTGGTQPLIIDQPEDDIDNRYVYDVVVGLIRQRKFQRQIIIASHNANIPVNGDAELIAVLGVDSGLGHLKDCGSIDRLSIKELVNDVMEGSREAFRLRRERYGY